MNAIFSFSSRIVRILALIGAIGTVAMMLHICLDVLLRNVFHISLVTAPEVIARYYMVIVAFLPLAWLERNNGMISVELLEWGMGPRMRQISDISVALLSTIAYVMLTWATGKSALGHYSVGTFVEFVNFRMPVWHSFLIPPIGFGLAAIICLIKMAEFIVLPIHSQKSGPLT